MAFTNHAEHFLTRIDRLNTWQAELALGLYRDEELLTFVLGLADLPEGTERVAISLSEREGEAEKGPYVIVTRQGRFVTCLGEGMKLQHDQVLISHHKLEQLSSRVERWRVMFAEARAGKRQRCDQLMMRITEAGHDITQSQFDDIVALSPIVGHLQVNALLGVQQEVDNIYLELRGAKRFGRYLDPLLEPYWRNIWAMSHFTMLIGEDPRFLQKFFDLVDASDNPNPETGRTIFTLSSWMTGLMPWALRGAWLAAQLPKAFLKPLKVAFNSPHSHHDLHAAGVGLAAIGHRHQRYRAEVVKFLQSAESHQGTRYSELTRHLAKILVTPFTQPEPTAFSNVDLHWDTLMAGPAKLHAPSHMNKAHFAALPSATKLAFSMTLPLPLDDDPTDFMRTYLWLPMVAKMHARDFYLPDRDRHRLLKQGYDYRTGLAFIAGRVEVEPPQPLRVTALPGRNEPCSCGSGRKFKRCCEPAVAVSPIHSKPRDVAGPTNRRGARIVTSFGRS